MKTTPTIGCVIITHNAASHLPHCLPPLLNSPLNPRVLVVNSSSPDSTVEDAKKMGAETLVIPRDEFNHGTTRERARQYLGTDIICMHTPDAYLKDSNTLEQLIKPLIEKKAAVAYGKQIARPDADFFETFPRSFNYPNESHLRSILDIEKYGVYTFFCSNSFAAYSNEALNEIGGFPPVLLGEDTVAVSKILQKGHKIAYVADAIAEHSHRYTLWQEFRRSFDTGLARKSYESVFPMEMNDTKRGFAYSKDMRKTLYKEGPWLLPYAFFHCLIKWFGYAIGKNSVNAPKWVKKAISTQDFYWK